MVVYYHIYMYACGGPGGCSVFRGSSGGAAGGRPLGSSGL